MESDLTRLQDQLESEKRLRTERLRRASERVMQLMASTTLGEGKVEVLKAQLHAERELREKLEEELDSLRAGAAACGGRSGIGNRVASGASSGKGDRAASAVSSGIVGDEGGDANRAGNHSSRIDKKGDHWQSSSTISAESSSSRNRYNGNGALGPSAGPIDTLDNTHLLDLDLNRRIRPSQSQSQSAAASIPAFSSTTATAASTSHSETFGRHRQHRREKASDGMSSSPLEMTTTFERRSSSGQGLSGIEGVIRDLNGTSGGKAGNGRKIRHRSPLRGVLKRQRKDSEEIDSSAAAVGAGNSGYGYADQSEREVW